IDELNGWVASRTNGNASMRVTAPPIRRIITRIAQPCGRAQRVRAQTLPRASPSEQGLRLQTRQARNRCALVGTLSPVLRTFFGSDPDTCRMRPCRLSHQDVAIA